MRLTHILIVVLFLVLWTTKVSAAPTFNCVAENRLNSIMLQGAGQRIPNLYRLTLNFRNLHHTYSSDNQEKEPYSLNSWFDDTEYRDYLVAGERYIANAKTTLFLELEIRTLSVGRLDGDDPERFVGYYKIHLRAGGVDALDSRPVQFFDIVNVENGDVLNVRSAPNSGAAKVGEIPWYESGVLGFSARGNGNWFFINFGGVEGWVSGRFLKPGRSKEHEFKGLIECEYGY